MDRLRLLHLLGHLPLVILALTAILGMTQACSSNTVFFNGYGAPSSGGYGSYGYDDD